VSKVIRLQVHLVAVTALASGLACLLASHLIWNHTPSLPRGLYWLARGHRPARHDLVAFRVPENVRRLVRERAYLEEGAWLVKPVVALAGDGVCTDSGALTIDGVRFGSIRTTDSDGRPLPQAPICGAIADGQLYVAGADPRSFDSRVFGPIRVSDLQGTVTPLWTYSASF
jgi:conjugative transfer signal peptidase TraF